MIFYPRVVYVIKKSYKIIYNFGIRIRIHSCVPDLTNFVPLPQKWYIRVTPATSGGSERRVTGNVKLALVVKAFSNLSSTNHFEFKKFHSFVRHDQRADNEPLASRCQCSSRFRRDSPADSRVLIFFFSFFNVRTIDKIGENAWLLGAVYRATAAGNVRRRSSYRGVAGQRCAVPNGVAGAAPLFTKSQR